MYAVSAYIYAMSVVLCVLLLLTGLFFTVRTRLVQVRRFWPSLLVAFPGKKADTAGGVSTFEAGCTALAATIGTGNIAGVAGALLFAGPGVLFWMWVSAFFGMATKYAEILFAMRYRVRTKNGREGGPMYYIERGLPKALRFLSAQYCVCCLAASFGMGNLVQVNTVVESVVVLVKTAQPALPTSAEILLPLAVGGGIALLTGLAMLGGAKRIGSISAVLVPIMSVLYLGCACAVIAKNADMILPSLRAIFVGAFRPRALLGGACGITFSRVLGAGLSRGTFTHESGLGTSALAHSLADTKNAHRQALFGIFEVFLDTIVICTITGLAVLASGIPLDFGSSAEAGAVVTRAFTGTFGKRLSAAFLSLATLLFAVSSMLAFSLYGERCTRYLWKGRGVPAYRLAFLICIVFSSLVDLSSAWRVSEWLNLFLALPNVLALLLLSRKRGAGFLGV